VELLCHVEFQRDRRHRDRLDSGEREDVGCGQPLGGRHVPVPEADVERERLEQPPGERGDDAEAMAAAKPILGGTAVLQRELEEVAVS